MVLIGAPKGSRAMLRKQPRAVEGTFGLLEKSRDSNSGRPLGTLFLTRSVLLIFHPAPAQQELFLVPNQVARLVQTHFTQTLEPLTIAEADGRSALSPGRESAEACLSTPAPSKLKAVLCKARNIPKTHGCGSRLNH